MSDLLMFVISVGHFVMESQPFNSILPSLKMKRSWWDRFTRRLGCGGLGDHGDGKPTWCNMAMKDTKDDCIGTCTWHVHSIYRRHSTQSLYKCIIFETQMLCHHIATIGTATLFFLSQPCFIGSYSLDSGWQSVIILAMATCSNFQCQDAIWLYPVNLIGKIEGADWMWLDSSLHHFGVGWWWWWWWWWWSWSWWWWQTVWPCGGLYS